MKVNDRESLHKELDQIIDAAEREGQRLVITDLDKADLHLTPTRKPQALKVNMVTTIDVESFAPEYRSNMNHLSKRDGTGRMDVTLMVILGFPAKTFADYEEWKAKQEAAAGAVTPEAGEQQS